MKRKQSKFYQNYLDNKLKLKTYQKVGIVLLVVVISGFIGWVWEFIINEIEGGFQHLYIEGGNLLPWINLYAYGALLIMIVTYRLRRYPWLVFVVAFFATGILELLAGWLAYMVYGGTRYWDYSGIWWGIGNIDGFVCPASAFCFGLGGLLLNYALLPFCTKLSLTMTKRKFLTLSITLFTIIMIDDIVNLTLKTCNLPTAMDFYYSIGWRYLN